MKNKIKTAVFRTFIRGSARLAWAGKTAKHIAVLDLAVEQSDQHIPLRLYLPPGDGPFPVVVYFHGGGWVIGDLATYDPMCRDLCDRSDAIVVAVDYRRAPEFPFPAAPDDCLAALAWVAEHIALYGGRADSIVLAGDSAGGNLAAVTAIQARSEMPGLVKGQILIYPVTDHYVRATASYTENAQGPVLTRSIMIWFWDSYFANSRALEAGQLRHPLATPLTVDDLSGLPPALVITAERDPLKDEGIAYANKLAEQGVAVTQSLYPGATHGFIGLQGPTRLHKEGMMEICAWLAALFGRQAERAIEV
ncbi:acetyl esterase [Zhongshania antarctica]|uniref:Acetyl esterase n=1 Tax=Zhongshania antarctica TaxID=641702 RepID=A0A840R0E9_9GAMM|nr:alpha/beta hydrolase [Zhongshania antarctica]MBB5185931.1 acetyl esterase [Zhongshania antarctica]